MGTVFVGIAGPDGVSAQALQLTGGRLEIADTTVERARKVHPGQSRTVRPQEQVNLVLGVKGLTRTDPRRYALGVLNTALGGGTS